MNTEHLDIVRLHDLVRICHVTSFFIWHNNSSRSLPPKSWGGRWEDNNGITHCCRRLKSILERTLHMMIFLHIAIFLETFIMPGYPVLCKNDFPFFPVGDSFLVLWSVAYSDMKKDEGRQESEQDKKPKIWVLRCLFPVQMSIHDHMSYC